MKKILSFVLLLIAVLPVTVSATPILYTVSDGHAYYRQADGYEDVNLHGYVIIDDESFVIDDSESPEHIFYGYSILDYRLSTKYESWVGGGDNFDRLLTETDGFLPNGEPYSSFHHIFMSSFILSGGDASYKFLSADGTLYEYPMSIDSWMTLAPQISVRTETLVGSTARGSEFTLIRRASVPEPTTLILLSLGLVGFGFTRRKIKI